MREIKPLSFQDCIDFVKGHSIDLGNRTYSIQIEESWLPHLPEDVLFVLAKKGNDDTRQMIAAFNPISANILEKLAKDKNTEVRCNVVRNPNASKNVLEMLADDDSETYSRGAGTQKICYFVARNINTPKKTLKLLARHADFWVRGGVIKNPSTPVSILQVLANDKKIGYEIADNPNAPREIIKARAKNGCFFARRKIAEDPATSHSVLQKLAEDNHNSIRVAVAKNFNTPVSILQRLANDSCFDVQEVIIKNPNTPSEVLKALVKKSYKSYGMDYDHVGRRAHWTLKDRGIDYKGICFIATAVYGSPSAQQVVFLREFRDNKLQTPFWGHVVNYYYRTSPPIASFLCNHSILKLHVKYGFLEPLIWLLKLFIRVRFL